MGRGFAISPDFEGSTQGEPKASGCLKNWAWGFQWYGACLGEHYTCGSAPGTTQKRGFGLSLHGLQFLIWCPRKEQRADKNRQDQTRGREADRVKVGEREKYN